MGYRVVRLTELMAYEFGQVEGDIGRLDERALGSALPLGMSYSSFMDKLKSGELALLTDSPSKPVMLPIVILTAAGEVTFLCWLHCLQTL